MVGLIVCLVDIYLTQSAFWVHIASPLKTLFFAWKEKFNSTPGFNAKHPILLPRITQLFQRLSPGERPCAPAAPATLLSSQMHVHVTDHKHKTHYNCSVHNYVQTCVTWHTRTESLLSARSAIGSQEV